MREKLIRFMQGRNGMDYFSRFLIYTGLIIMLLFSFIHVPAASYIGLLISIYGYFRVFSRNYAKRSAENRWYMGVKGRIRNAFRNKGGAGQSPYHKIFSCPGCKQQVRVPKGRGKIEITCPKCGRSFIKRT